MIVNLSINPEAVQTAITACDEAPLQVDTDPPAGSDSAFALAKINLLSRN